MLTKNKKIDQITIGEDGTLFIREATIIMDDDIQISKSFHRTTLEPGSDITDWDQSVKDIANVVWTPEVVDAYLRKTYPDRYVS